MQAVVLFVGVFFFATGLSLVASLVTGEWGSINISQTRAILSIGAMAGMIWVLVDTGRNGWRKKDLKLGGKIAGVIAVLKILHIFGIGITLVRIASGGYSLDEDIMLLLLAGINVIGWLVWRKAPRNWLIISMATIDIVLIIGYMLLLWGASPDAGARVIIYLTGQAFMTGFIIIFALQARFRRKKWNQYEHFADEAIGGKFRNTESVPVTWLLNGLNDAKLAIRRVCATALAEQPYPEAIQGIAKTLDRKPPVFWLDTREAATQWKLFSKEAAPALKQIQERNAPYVQAYPHVYCIRCLSKAVLRHAQRGRPYVLCPKCTRDDRLEAGVKRVLGTLGPCERTEREDSDLRIGLWDADKKTVRRAQIDEMLIVGSSEDFPMDWAINAFVQNFENNIHNRGKKMKINWKNPELVSENSKQILKEIELP